MATAKLDRALRRIDQLKDALKRREEHVTVVQTECTNLVNQKRELEASVENLMAMNSRLMPVTVVAAVIFAEDIHRFVIGKRKSSSVLGGYWHWIGGKVRPGETKDRALKREVKEEINGDIEVGQFICHQLVQYDHGTFDVHFYECTMEDSVDLEPRECAIRTVKLQEVLDYNMLEADMHAAEYVLYRNYFRDGISTEAEDDDMRGA